MVHLLTIQIVAVGRPKVNTGLFSVEGRGLSLSYCWLLSVRLRMMFTTNLWLAQGLAMARLWVWNSKEVDFGVFFYVYSEALMFNLVGGLKSPACSRRLPVTFDL